MSAEKEIQILLSLRNTARMAVECKNFESLQQTVNLAYELEYNVMMLFFSEEVFNRKLVEIYG